jgi:hypothetical protein
MMGALQVFLGLYATALPFAILGAWLAVSLWDIARRASAEDLARGPAIGWTLGVLFVPVVGSAGYLAGASSLPRWLGATFVAGGIGAYLVILALAGGLSAAG